ncbi:MAG: Trp family transcriptional regulator [Desulfobacteraceae bacterium]
MGVDRDFLEQIFSIKDIDELEIFFKEMFTPGELNVLSLRWKLLTDLHKGMTQRKIAEKYNISLCKITRGSKILKNKDSIALKLLEKKGDN